MKSVITLVCIMTLGMEEHLTSSIPQTTSFALVLEATWIIVQTHFYGLPAVLKTSQPITIRKISFALHPVRIFLL